MPEDAEVCYYENPASHLSQGDIFRIDVVGPGADFLKRIFRSADGRHGSCVFEEECNARVFSPNELEEQLKKVERGLLHTDPFCSTHDGNDEMVVVFAKLLKYFIIATQTCDICGRDKPPSPHAVILPVVPFAIICRTERLPLDGTEKGVTIHDFITQKCPQADDLNDADDMNYPEKLREAIRGWTLNKNDPMRAIVGKIKDFIGGFYKQGYLHYLAKESIYNMPESGIDFSMIFTVPSQRLNNVKTARIATLRGDYRNQFSRAFAEYFGRIAVPRSMSPPKI
ncbi:MAG: hypothetical protein JW709_07605 [Sedimentisphaerales bacterium]|nr:hypothetical protein [Sedimentisphaerales bacterium]